MLATRRPPIAINYAGKAYSENGPVFHNRCEEIVVKLEESFDIKGKGDV